jgi:hypothetical protein
MTYFLKILLTRAKTAFILLTPAVADCCHNVFRKAMFLFQAGQLRTGGQYFVRTLNKPEHKQCAVAAISRHSVQVLRGGGGRL